MTLSDDKFNLINNEIANLTRNLCKHGLTINQCKCIADTVLNIKNKLEELELNEYLACKEEIKSALNKLNIALKHAEELGCNTKITSSIYTTKLSKYEKYELTSLSKVF